MLQSYVFFVSGLIYNYQITSNFTDVLSLPPSLNVSIKLIIIFFVDINLPNLDPWINQNEEHIDTKTNKQF
jgi:hypothetical protein